MAKGRVESKLMKPPGDVPKGHKLYKLQDEYLGSIKPEYPAGVDMSQYPEAESFYDIMAKRKKQWPWFNEAFAMDGMMNAFMLHDINAVTVIREWYGDQAALDFYDETWRRDMRKYLPETLEAVGYKPDGSDVNNAEDLAKVSVLVFEGLGNPAEIIESSPDYAYMRVYRCPYTEQSYKYYDEEERNSFNNLVQFRCNLGMMDELINLCGLKGKYEGVFPGQICLGDEGCAWAFKSTTAH
jgi:hypothetical protein